MTANADVVLWSGNAAISPAWRTHAAPGCRAELAADVGALRFDFALVGHGAFAIARCEFAFALPAHYVATLCLRGDAPPCELQLKLVDPSAANVWWWRRPGFTPSRTAQRIALRRAGLAFAWGPASGADPREIGAVELAVAADHAVAGSYWIEDLRVEPREATSHLPQPRSARASSCVAGHEPERALETDARSSWRPDAGDARPWLELDLGVLREWGGLAVDFGDAAHSPDCRLLASDDAAHWTLLAHAPAAPGAQRWLRCGEAESRFVRLELEGARGAEVARVAVVPIERAASPARFAAAVAKRSPRGWYPRHLLGEHTPWAVVGADGDEHKGMLGADGALEVSAESFTLEPFLAVGERVLGWADADAEASLAEGCLPIPSVRWQLNGLRLEVSAFALGAPGESALVARYRVTNPGAAALHARLLVAIRPFQVTPAWQSLNLSPAVAPIESIARSGAWVRVNGAREVVAVSAPDRFAAVGSEQELAAVFAGRLPDAESAADPLGAAEGWLAFDLVLAPAASESVVIALPLHAATPPLPAGLARAEAAAWAEARLAETTAYWRERLACIPISLPPAAAAIDQTLRASVAWLLVNREGRRIQPGPRCYRRSWIRDGALSGTALAELGFGDELAAFLRWYAPFQHADGRVPCAVDRRGLDLAIEHDSHGEFVWAVVEHWRLTGKLDLLRELWPRVLHAVDAIAALRAERTREDLRGDPCFGLLPESISHEGYASRPVHAYWDDFFAVRALADAADAAAALGDAARARIAALRDAMRGDLHASIAATIARHGIDFLPGSVELGDFDATSSAIAFDPCGESERLPQAALRHTFERYWQEFEARRRGDRVQDAYTAYEIRNAFALLRIGWTERALALLEWLVADQRPPGWRQWPEVSARDPRAARFLGDLPHGWVASSFLRSVRRLLAYERDDTGVLVVAAGVPEAWLRSGEGVRARGLPTHFGVLDLALRADGQDRVRAVLGGSCRPPAGIALALPLPRRLREVRVGGRSRALETSEQVLLRELPAEVELLY